VQDIGVKERKYMNRKISYTDGEIGNFVIIDDFLPPPDKLVAKNYNIKITLSLTKNSIDFFKQEAKKHQTGYQSMIRKLLDDYTKNYTKSINL
jgi:predicted DNA binding CopG/RHH family protein